MYVLPYDKISRFFRSIPSNNVLTFIYADAEGEKVRTLYGDGSVMTVYSSLNEMRYKVQLNFGVAFLRSDAVVHRLPSKSVNKRNYHDDGDTAYNDDINHPALNEHIVSFFATESIYLFLRVYCLLVHILSRVKECIETGILELNDFSGICSTIPSMEHANTAHGKMRVFHDILNSIKECVKGEVDSKTLETRCRTLSRTSVYLATTIPKLLETLHQSFSTVCQEGLLIPLFDYCMQRSMVSIKSVAK